MHSAEVVEKARALRAQGVPVKEVARLTGVSVGWASLNLSDIKVERDADRRFLEASADDLADDEKKNGKRRAEWLRLVSPGQQDRRWESIARLVDETEGITVRPARGTKSYKALDNLQGLFGSQPQSWVFAMIGGKAPRLLSHLVKWSRTKRLGEKPGTIGSFVPMVQELGEFMRRNKRAPANNATDERERNMARFVSRWKSIVTGHGERSANMARADAMTGICKLVDQLRSPYEHEQSVALMAVGGWELQELVQNAIEVGSRQEDGGWDD